MHDVLTQFICRTLAIAIGVCLWCAPVAIAAAPSVSLPASSSASPNIIFIFADDLGYNDLGCYGAPQIKTPRLDKLAAEGIRFTDFYSAAPVCTPSRAALMTGCYAQRVGLGEVPQKMPNARSARVLYAESPYGLSPDEITIAEVLKARGYTTGMVGKWHLGDAKPFLPTRQGFDSYFGLPYSNDMAPLVYIRGDEVVERDVNLSLITERYTEEASKFIRDNKDKPFFLYLAHNAPHTPLHAHPKFKGKSERGLYGDIVEELDDSVGQILDLLKELNLDENTLVIFSSDNGPWHLRGENGGSATPLRAAKGTTYEGGMRVPCVMRWPGRIPAGSVCREIAATIDILPTFAALTGASVPTDRVIDGKDISALMFSKPGAKSLHEFYYFYSGNRLNAVRSGPWKLRLTTTLQEETEYGKYEHPDSLIEPKLFNLVTDPGEQKSVLKDHPKITERLTKLADDAKQDLGDARSGVSGKNVRPIGKVTSP